MHAAFRAKNEHRSWSLLRLILFSVVLTLLAAVIYCIYGMTFDSRTINRDVSMEQVNTAVEITKDTAVSQEFRYDKALYGISVLVKNPDNHASGHIRIQVRGLTTGSILYDGTYEAKNITDGMLLYLGFGDQVTSEEGYEILASSKDAVSGSALSLWMAQTVSKEVPPAVINGKTAASSLAFTACENDTSYHPEGLFINRLAVALLFFAFILVHFFVDIPRMYDWIFRKRFWIAAGVVILFVINKYNFSSTSLYNDYFQYNYGSGYLSTILGYPNGLRSDEWAINTPARLSAWYTGYARINNILEAMPQENFSITGLYFCFAALSRPLLWGYFLGGSVYGLSFCNIALPLGTFLASFEMFLILTQRKRLYSLLGGVLITFSSYFLWWTNVAWILAAEGAFVCLYYFLHSDKSWKRILLMIGMAIFGSNFLTELYPAWQVPAGYLFLVFIIWMLAANRDKIKALRARDWVILVLGLCFLLLISAFSLWESRGYIHTIMNTTYPGHRISTGGYALDKLFANLRAWSTSFFGMYDITYEGVFLNFFPLPMIAAAILLIKKKGKDGLLASLVGLSLILTVYCSVGFPDFLARITLLSYSFPQRTADVIGLIGVYLLILCLCRLEDMKRPKLLLSILVMLLLGIVSVLLCGGKMNDPRELILAAAALLCAAILFSDAGEKERRGAAILLIVISASVFFFVLPLAKGVDAVYTKPVSHEIQMLNEGGGKRWVTVNSYLSGNLLAALGAPAITSMNVTPNYELWASIDPDGKSREIYDRYAMCQIIFCPEETHFVQRRIDCFDLYLSYNDIYKLKADYIFSNCKLADNSYVHFEQVYYEAGSYIYKPIYGQGTP